MEHKEIRLYPDQEKTRDRDNADYDRYQAYKDAIVEIDEILSSEYDAYFSGEYCACNFCMEVLFYDFGSDLIYTATDRTIMLYADGNPITLFGYPLDEQDRELINEYWGIDDSDDSNEPDDLNDLGEWADSIDDFEHVKALYDDTEVFNSIDYILD